jgi:hypothetical protein
MDIGQRSDSPSGHPRGSLLSVKMEKTGKSNGQQDDTVGVVQASSTCVVSSGPTQFDTRGFSATAYRIKYTNPHQAISPKSISNWVRIPNETAGPKHPQSISSPKLMP